MTRTTPNDPWLLVEVGIDLRDALPCLTKKQAEALGLWYEGYAQREIGEMLGIGRPAAARRIQRGLARLRGYIERM